MKKLKIFSIIVSVLLVISVGIQLYPYIVDSLNLGVGGTSSFNRMENLTTKATSTGSYGVGNLPVKLLDKDADRRYVHIQNNSDTAIFLYATNSVLDLSGTGKPRYASGTITALNGIRLEPLDGDNLDDTYVIGPDNMITGHIWASSTAGATKKEILVSYK